MPDEQSTLMDTAGRQFYFLHIPKTAGTSLRSLIEAQFPPESICPSNEVLQAYGGNYPPIRWVLEVPQADFDRCGLVRGHYFHNMVAKFSRIPIRLTMLRRPLDRSISFLRHTLRGGPSFADTTIDQLATNTHFIDKYLRDFQVKMLALEFDNSDPSKVPVDVNVPLVCGPRMLERAKKVLDELEWVGLAEEFERSMALLHSRFGWNVGDTSPKLNRSPRKMSERDTPSEATLQILRECTQLDEKLYEHAVGVFQRQCEGACLPA